MPYYNGDPKRDHNFDNHPYTIGLYSGLWWLYIGVYRVIFGFMVVIMGFIGLCSGLWVLYWGL